jgi:hypothetical protein
MHVDRAVRNLVLEDELLSASAIGNEFSFPIGSGTSANALSPLGLDVERGRANP